MTSITGEGSDILPTNSHSHMGNDIRDIILTSLVWVIFLYVYGRGDWVIIEKYKGKQL